MLGADTHPERGYFFRSDHFPFAKAGVPALSLSEPKEFTGPNGAALLAKQEAYNGKDYHQPTDQYDASWDFSGGVDDLRALAQLGWRIAAAGRRCRSTTPAISSRKSESRGGVASDAAWRDHGIRHARRDPRRPHAH